MKHSDFVHLHVHTQYSLLDGACRLQELVDLASAMKMPACAITDHGNMFGAIEFYQKAVAKGVKPIIGSEVYVAPESRFEKSSHGIHEASFHLVLLAKDETGYKNLMKLISIGYTEGFYYRPRVDKEVLAKYNDGLIALSACLKGEIPHLALSGDMASAKRVADQFRHIFGRDNFYLELQDNGIEDQNKVNKSVIKIAKELDIPLVATNDVHYLHKDDAEAHEALLAIQTQTTLDDPNRLRMQTNEFYFKPPELIKKSFESVEPSSITNTIGIAERCNLELNFDTLHLPQYTPPEGATREGYLRKLVEEGLKKRYSVIDKTVEERVKHELEIVEKSGYTSYFLIAWDFVNFAKSNNIPVGPGRGSAAGSVVSYALGITDVDPLRYGLIFERFLNPERISMPDIDIDFCYERRNEVIDYVINKYSKKNVAQIITFGTMMAKAVVRDVARVMGIPYAEADRIAKLIPNELNITLDQALKTEPELDNLYKTDPRITKLVDISRKLEGLTRHASTHAAGVVISERDLTDYVPLFETSDGQITTGVPMNSLEKIGLLKMDFLGLRTLTVISETMKIVKRTRFLDIDIEKISLDDKNTYKLLAAAESIGIFQLESSGMRDLLKKLKPERFEEIIALLALFRPGPIGSGMLDDFIGRKHKRTGIKYDHPLLEPILKDTYGIIVFQEQIMRIASELAGFSLAEADTLRRAISKKTPEIMAEARHDFVNGAAKKGIDRNIADKIFNQIEYFAGYGFNKCVIGSTELINADTGQPVTVEQLYLNKNYIKVFSCDEQNLKIIPQKIKDIVCNGRKKTYRLKTETAKEITVTGNHPFLTISGWKELHELKNGDMIATPATMTINSQRTLENYKIITLANLLAEGNLCHTSGFYFYNNNKEEVDDFVRNIEQFETTKARVGQRREGYEVYVGTGYDTRFVAGMSPWNKKAVHENEGYRKFPKSGARIWLEDLDLIDKKSDEKFVPLEVFLLSSEQIALFIGRLWSGDGFIFGKNNTTPYYATSSEKMAKGIQHLLLRLDIVATIKEKEFKYKYKELEKRQHGYAVYLFGRSSIENFLEKVCPHIIGKENQITSLRDYYKIIPANMESKNVVPSEIKTLIKKEKTKLLKTWREIERESGVSVRELSGSVKPHKKGFRRETIRRLADYFQSSELLKYSTYDIFWDRIKSIEYACIENTYDVEMEKVHNFIANDIVVHNSHSTAYSLISYRTAYLKANFPIEFMTALLTSERDDTDKIALYINEAIRMEINILPPDVNESLANFTVVEGGIRFGLTAVKNVGQTAIDSIIESRSKFGKFKSLYDFTQRVDSRLVNRKVIESLIKCGAFDSLGLRRSQELAILDKAIEIAGGVQKDKLNGQHSFFDMFDIEENFQKTFQEVPDIPEWPENQLLSYEKEMLGFYITKHPLARFERLLTAYSSAAVAALSAIRDGEEVRVGGIISKAKITTTRRTGEKMAIINLEDLSGTVETLVFPRVFQKFSNLIRTDSMVFITGRLNLREEEPKLVADEIIPLEDVKSKFTKTVLIRLNTPGLEKTMLEGLKEIFLRHRGKIPIMLNFKEPNGRKISMSAGRNYTVKIEDSFLDEIEKLCGAGSVGFKT